MAVLLLTIRRTRRRGRTFLILIRLLLLCALLILIIYPTARAIRAHSPRQIPTRFPSSKSTATDGFDLSPLFPPPREKPFRRIEKHTLDIDGGRYMYLKTLARGYEGEGRVYLDTQYLGGRRKVVIKTFFGGTRVNPLPEHLLDTFNPRTYRAAGWHWHLVKPLTWMLAGSEFWGTAVRAWPAEIPATLWFNRSDGENKGFVRPLDYFYVNNRWFGTHWQLVMPYYEDGTLDDLAFLVRRLELKPHEVDRVYRGEFLAFLETLERMHRAGYCHDDIKTDNIFLSPATTESSSIQSNLTMMRMNWLVSDLGNVREITHIWHHARPGLARPPLKLDMYGDCRVVDITRALKTYLTFLRHATGENMREREFDQEFYRGQAGWSWIYWQFMLNARTTDLSGGEKYTPGEILRMLLNKEQKRRRKILEDDEEDIEADRADIGVYVQKILEEISILAREWKSWRAGTLGREPLWVDGDRELVNSWKEGVKIPLEPQYKEADRKLTKEKYNRQNIITKEMDQQALREAVDLELDCMANEKERVWPERILGRVRE